MDFQFRTGQVTVNTAKAADLWQDVEKRFANGRGFALATLNLDHLVKLDTDPDFCRAYQAHDLVVADGNPIVWMSHLAKRPVELMPGSELILPLAKIAADMGVKVALVGSTEDSLTRAAAALVGQVPGLQITRVIAPPFGFDPNGEQAAQIFKTLNEDEIGLCFLALGAPKQEMFAARGRSLSPQVGFASIGAGLDFLAGHQKRAPRWVRAIAMEWAWRMALSPARLFGRYMRCFAILPRHIRAALRQRKSRADSQ